MTSRIRLIAPRMAALAVTVALALPAAAQTTVVTQDDVSPLLTGTLPWCTAFTRTGGAVSFSGTPAGAPAGAGSLRMNTDAAIGGPSQAKAQLMTDMFGSYLRNNAPNPDRPDDPDTSSFEGGLRLADINAISYWSWRATTNTNPAPQVISLNMEVDFAGTGASFTTLVYEPIYNASRQGPIIPGVWQDWDAFDGGLAIWWSTASIPGTPAGTFSSTWNHIKANNPNARITRFFGFNIGSGWTGVSENAADLLTLGTTTEGTYVFDFEFARTVRIDVRPNNTDNQINTRARQLVPIAILSEVDFDACAEVEIESIDVRGANANATNTDCEDVDGDGLDDLILYFRARDMDDPTAEECGSLDPMIELTGFTTNAAPFRGTDTVRWSGPACE